MSTENKTAIIAITENGKKLAKKVSKLLGDSDVYFKISTSNFNCGELIESATDIKSKNNIYYIDKKLKDFVGEVFSKYDKIVFIMAAGIVVRTIAPFIQSKFYDPAVLVIDEQGKNVISLLSGHIGGSNELTYKISGLIGANPVITTATDVNKKSALDMIAKKLNAHIDNFRESVKDVNAYLVNNKPVGIYIDGNYDIDLRGFEVLNANNNLIQRCCESQVLTNNVIKVNSQSPQKIVVVTDRRDINIKIDEDEKINFIEVDIIKVVPKDIVVGIGCRKGISSEFMYDSFLEFLYINNIDIKSIAKVGSIELKKDEKAIQDLANHLEVPFVTFSQNEISQIDDKYEKSDFVKRNVGVHSVSEPAAHLLSDGNLIVNKHKYSGITFALGRIKL